MTFRRDVPATPPTPRAAIIQGNSTCSPEPMPDSHHRRMSSLVQVLMAQYLQSFFFWSQVIAVQAFSVLSSLSNLQPWRSCDLVVMVIILYISFAANITANHFIFNRSIGAVSAIRRIPCRVAGEHLLSPIWRCRPHSDGRWCAISSSGPC